MLDKALKGFNMGHNTNNTAKQAECLKRLAKEEERL